MEPERALEIYLEVVGYSDRYPAGKLIHELYEELMIERNRRIKAEADTWRSITRRNTAYIRNAQQQTTEGKEIKKHKPTV